MHKPLAVEAIGLGKQVGHSESSISILSDLSVAISQGEKVAIVGSSGSGKSTLLSLLAGLDNPSAGKVLINGEEISSLDEDGRAAMRAKYIGFVFQSFQLLPSLTALENVMLPMQLRGDASASAISKDALDKVGLGARISHYPKQLSGGEQQRVAIARAFAAQPAVLFADEPTGNLDVATGEKIVDLLFELNKGASTTLVLVTHDLRLAARCERTLQLKQGKLEDTTGVAH